MASKRELSNKTTEMILQEENQTQDVAKDDSYSHSILSKSCSEYKWLSFNGMSTCLG